MGERFNWSEFRPSKGQWFWSCVACIVLTMLIGFTWGGWVTGGTAEERVADASEDARATLAATVCTNKFLDAPDAAIRLAQLKEASSWERDDFIEDGGWTTLVGLEEPVDGAADRCAEQLAEMDLPAANEAASAETVESAVN